MAMRFSTISLKKRADPPAVGSTVTYKYQEKTRAGMPRFPVFLRVCPPR